MNSPHHIGQNPVQRRCDKCNKATLVNSGRFCQLYCTLKKETVSKYEWCPKFYYGRLDRAWVK